ncbi:helix-turn-helix domain-containing protein [Allobacillus sp. GCM10007491]|uniref:Helix-turn-helix domain-containing protein n=2 Tax=Allobacillus TaxID=1400133 RepID=A0A941CVC8_9BACI|nr:MULTISPECIES: helix-turn-helix transcriptional regulator [Allobacillus]MBR7554657.1 helix-turn-helix domain-containing protein [Allobacillus saliphilus]TSJ62428.1 helix-turn-helix domain-containing protein [Allobacillus salarius]
MDIGAIIQYYRTKKGYTQKQMADGICSVSYLSKIENEMIKPKEDVARLLFDRLDISYDDITHSNNKQIVRKVFKLYKRIKEKDYEAARESIEELNRILTPFHAPKALSIFQLVHFYFIIQTRENDKVEQMYREVIRLEDRFKDENLYLFHKVIGLYFNYKAQPNKALSHFETAKTMSVQLSINDTEIYYLLALSLTRIRKPAQSNYYCQIAKDQFEADFLYTNVTDCYILFGVNYMLLEAYEVSEKYFLQVLNSKPMGDSPDIQRRVKHNLAILYFYMEEYDRSISYMEELNEYDYNLYDKIQSYYMQAKIHYLNNKNEQAIEFLEIGEKALREVKYLKYQYQFYVLRHQIYEKTTDPDFLKKAKNVLLPYFKNSGEKKTVKELSLMLGNQSYDTGDYKQAANFYKFLIDQFNQVKDEV